MGGGCCESEGEGERERTREIDPKPPSQADRPLTEELCDSPLSSSEPPYPVG